MEQEYRILIAEDVPSDVLLAEHELKQVLKNFTTRIVETEKDFVAALEEFKPDLVISDYKMPSFDGLRALNLTLEKSPLTPVIIATGSMNEETAVDCMKAGAADYVIKEHLRRLGQAVVIALEQKKIKAGILQAEERLKKASIDWNRTFDAIRDGIALLDIDQKIIQSNQAFRDFVKKTQADFKDKSCFHFVHHTENPIDGCPFVRMLKSKKRETMEMKINGLLCEILVDPILNENGEIEGAVHIISDITERKKNETIQQALYHISNAVVTTLDMEALVGIIRNELGRLIDTSNFFVALYDESSEYLTAPYKHDQKDQLSTWPIAKSMTGYVIQQNKSLLVTPKEVDEMIKAGTIIRYGVASACWLGVPMHIGDRVIGSLVVQNYNDPNAYSSKDMEIMEFVSDQIGLSIQQKRTEQEMIAAKEKAQESDRLKSAFLANMSHEIRTPMNAIVGFASMLADPETTMEERIKFTDIINSRTDDLLHLVNDILDISRIESGNINIVKGEVNLNNLLGEIETVSAQKIVRSGKPNLTLICEKPETSENTTIVSDPYIIKQVFTNLIDNAIKYTPFGSVRFGFFPPENNLLTCFVADTGIGIAPENQEVIFEHFRQVDMGHTRQYGGTGLGLAICKGSLSVLGGKISVESAPGKGSTFSFTIPFEQPSTRRQPTPSQTIHSAPIHQKQWTGKQLLVVEDDPANMEYLTIVLSRTGASLTHAVSGKELRSHFHRLDDFNAVLLDMRLPDSNGWELAQEIKTIRPELPVIAQTAYALETDREKSTESGCDGYISKPINRNKLLELLARYLES